MDWKHYFRIVVVYLGLEGWLEATLYKGLSFHDLGVHRGPGTSPPGYWRLSVVTFWGVTSCMIVACVWAGAQPQCCSEATCLRALLEFLASNLHGGGSGAQDKRHSFLNLFCSFFFTTWGPDRIFDSCRNVCVHICTCTYTHTHIYTHNAYRNVYVCMWTRAHMYGWSIV